MLGLVGEFSYRGNLIVNTANTFRGIISQTQSITKNLNEDVSEAQKGINGHEHHSD